MSFPAIYSELTDVERSIIVSKLKIVPCPPPQSSSFPFDATVRPFHFFLHNQERDEILLPLYFAQTLLCVNNDDVPSSSSWEKLDTTLVRLSDSSISLRPAQISIMNDSYEQIRNSNTTILHVPPGTGKTFMAIMIAMKLGLKFAILSPRSTLLSQWISSIRKLVVMTQSSSVIIYEPEQVSIEKKRVVVGSPVEQHWQIIVALGERVLGLPKEMRDRVGTLIIDESHLCCVPSWVNVLLAFSPKYVIALTATLDRPDKTHIMIEHLVGPMRVIRENKRPFVFLGCKVNDVCVPETINSKTGLLDYTKFVEHQSLNEVFNSAIVSLVLANRDRKFILLFRRVDHTERVCKMLDSAGITTGLMCGSKRKAYTDCQALCGSYSKISTGFDAATLAINFNGINPNTLILVNGVKQVSLFEQCAGRIMRANFGTIPIVISMITLNAITKRHFAGLKNKVTSMCGVVAQIPISTLIGDQAKTNLTTFAASLCSSSVTAATAV